MADFSLMYIIGTADAAALDIIETGAAFCFVLQLFRAPYGAGFWSADKASSSAVAHLWQVVRSMHIHVSW
jgi:hypothetical protein